MRKFVFRRASVALASATVALLPTSAHAVNAEHVDWLGTSWSICTTGSSSGWTCEFEVYSTSCQEVAVFGAPLASCYLYTDFEVDIFPMVNAAGRLVGCGTGSQVIVDGASVYFNSTFPEFDNASIDDLYVVQMQDTFGDGKPGILKIYALDERQGELGSEFWIVEATATATCKRGVGWTSGSATGTVDVQV